MLVAEEKVFGLVVGDVNVGISIAVEVSGGHAHGATLERADPGRVSHIRKCAVAIVVVQTVGIGFVVERTGIVVSRVVVAIFRIELNVTADEEIDATVLIVVEPCRADGPAVYVNASLGGNVGEGAVAVVVIKNRLAVTGYKQIDVAVVVIVGGDRGHPVDIRSDAGLIGYVGELAVALVAI